jgi:hypothetical protein
VCNADARDHRRVAKDGWRAGEVVKESNSRAKENRRDVDVNFVEEASIQAPRHARRAGCGRARALFDTHPAASLAEGVRPSQGMSAAPSLQPRRRRRQHCRMAAARFTEQHTTEPPDIHEPREQGSRARARTTRAGIKRPFDKHAR